MVSRPHTLAEWADALRNGGWKGRRVGAVEWAGPCPVCGGDNRFHVRKGDGEAEVLNLRK